MIILDFNNSWTDYDREKYINYLKSLEDIDYKNFNGKIVNTKLEMIGIRMPILKKIAREISKGNIDDYFKKINNKYYETIMIYGLVLAYSCEEYVDKYIMNYIECIDNWALCDTFCSSLKIVNKKLGKYWIYFVSLIDTDREFQTRVSIVMMMNYYLNDNYIDRVLNIVSGIKCDFYYVNMAISWLLSVAIINYKDKVISLLESRCLNKFVQNRTISKIQDSYRIDKELKEYVKSFRIV